MSEIPRSLILPAELASYGSQVDVHDPWCDPEEAKDAHDLDLGEAPEKGVYDVVVIAVAHDRFRVMGATGIRSFCKGVSVVYEVKYILPSDQVDDRL